MTTPKNGGTHSNKNFLSSNKEPLKSILKMNSECSSLLYNFLYLLEAFRESIRQNMLPDLSHLSRAENLLSKKTPGKKSSANFTLLSLEEQEM
jgi:hypothetical protein